MWVLQLVRCWVWLLQAPSISPDEMRQLQYVLAALVAGGETATLDAVVNQLPAAVLADVVIANMANLPPPVPGSSAAPQGAGLAGLLQVRDWHAAGYTAKPVHVAANKHAITCNALCITTAPGGFSRWLCPPSCRVSLPHRRPHRRLRHP